MSAGTFRPGWIPTPEHVARVRFERFLRPETVAVPHAVDHFSNVPYIGMMLNDTWGDCCCAADGHVIQGLTAYGQGSEVQVPDSDVLTAYETTGFNPDAGPPGNNPTDNGWTVEAALGYLKNTGMAGHRIALYGQIPVAATKLMVQAVYEFGYLSIGVNLPKIAVQQFNDGPPAGQKYPVWKTVPDDGGIDGGHAVAVAGYNATGPVAWTWGAVVQLTWAWYKKYTGEAWGIVSQDWINQHSHIDPAGVDRTVLGQEALAVFGANPFA